MEKVEFLFTKSSNC